MTSSICVIPARGNSRRIPRKNIKLFHGKPIISYSIETAKASGLFTDVWVSTEDEEIGRIAEGYGAKWYKRPKSLADDATGTQEVVRDFIQWMHSQDEHYEYVCCIYPTAPMLEPDDLKKAHEIHKTSPCCYVVSVGGNPVKDIGGFYFGRAESFLAGIPLWYHDYTHTVLIPDSRAIDINTPDDWARAEQMYADLQGAA